MYRPPYGGLFNSIISFYLLYLSKPTSMKKSFFQVLAKVNKVLLPSFSKKRLDLSKATKFQMAIIGWRYYVTTNALG